jgi:hypothetical protein
MSVMHPISRIRIETHVAMIRLKELPNGFHVVSAESASIQSLSELERKQFLDMLVSIQTYHPDNICCISFFVVEAIDATNSGYAIRGCSLGEYSDLASIQEEAATENGFRAELIQILNMKGALNL